MKQIPLTQNKFALVDDEDFEWLSRWKWSIAKREQTRYAMRGGHKEGKHLTILMHREILNPSSGMEIDHIDHNGLNNQRANLRFATRTQNSQNQRKRKETSSRFKGVYWDRQLEKWRVQIMINYKHNHIGLFDVEEDAARAYDRAARRLFGEFAQLNFEGELCLTG